MTFFQRQIAFLALVGWLMLPSLVQALPATGTTPGNHSPFESAQVPDTIAQRLAACAACHGKEGRATSDGYFPRIAGKPAGYLYNQLLNFREGRRHNMVMVNFVELLPDAYLREIAAYFSSLDLRYAAPQPLPQSADARARGEALALRGDKSRQLPACAQCHGVQLMGVQPATPGLLGLPRDYLLGELGAWRTHERHAMAPDCMATIANRLSPEDVGAVTTWLSQQVVPAGAKPELVKPATEPRPDLLTLICGSAVN